MKESDIIRQTRDFIPREVEFIQAEVNQITPENHAVALKDGRELKYDLLIVATGCRTAPEETAGMLGPKWRVNVHDFYTLDGARALREASRGLSSKVDVWWCIHLVEMPIKCPVAPLEFTFLADTFFRERGIRDKVTLTYVMLLSGAFTKPKALKKLGHLLGDKGIELVTDFVAERLDQENNKICSLLTAVRRPMGSAGDDTDEHGDQAVRCAVRWVMTWTYPTQKHTLQSVEYPDVFVIGDATNLPASKAGSAADFESETLADNVMLHIQGKPLKEEFDGHSNCFIESGNGKALADDFNYEYEPHEGNFPFAFGPMKLLEESRLNHLGKLAFRHVYWNMLLKAWPLPGISRQKKKPLNA